MKKFIVSLLGFLALSACSSQEHFVEVVAQSKPKTVMVEVKSIATRFFIRFTKDGISVEQSTVPVIIQGAGVYISANNHVLTCAHLFTGGPNLGTRIIDENGHPFPATELYISTNMDLGLLRVDGEAFSWDHARLSQEKLQVGEEVIAIGNPFGLSFSVTHGIISAFRPGFQNGYTFTQDDAAINPGNSGGPLFNLRGELIGITTLHSMEGECQSFAVAPETIRKFLSLFKGVE